MHSERGRAPSNARRSLRQRRPKRPHSPATRTSPPPGFSKTKTATLSATNTKASTSPDQRAKGAQASNLPPKRRRGRPPKKRPPEDPPKVPQATQIETVMFSAPDSIAADKRRSSELSSTCVMPLHRLVPAGEANANPHRHVSRTCNAQADDLLMNFMLEQPSGVPKSPPAADSGSASAAQNTFPPPRTRWLPGKLPPLPDEAAPPSSSFHKTTASLPPLTWNGRTCVGDGGDETPHSMHPELISAPIWDTYAAEEVLTDPLASTAPLQAGCRGAPCLFITKGSNTL
jgi:hypothetical protein